jgi:trans-2,3-dihydro-3-hydroxyanthranilate isomerase
VRTYAFHQVDVFAEQPLAGNPLAVVVAADGLSPGEMQAIAREMNLSETTFVSAPEAGGHARVRIFTPLVELPFAGHPSVGTACELVRLGLVAVVEPVTRVVLELGVGPTVVDVDVRDGEPVGATVHQGRPRFGRAVDRRDAAAVLGLAAEDLHPDLEPVVVATGLAYTIVPLASVDALARVELDSRRLPAFEREHAEAYPWAFTGRDDPWIEARGLFPLAGIPEDPATGSAAGPLAAYVARAGLLLPGEQRVVLQGRHTGRPSRLTVAVTAGPEPVAGDASSAAQGLFAGADGVGTPFGDVTVGGPVRLVARGELYLGD